MRKLKPNNNLKPIIAIDGTAGSGKGTLAKKLSRILNFDHLDTGILYRICASEIIEKGISFNQINIKLWLSENNDLNKLRTDEVSKKASKISKEPDLRKFLLKFQRDFGNHPPGKKGSVIDGRDIGSVVFPSADVKFFIDADPKIRAKRRLEELNLKNEEYKKTLNNILERDERDKNRIISPLIQTKDAFAIDSSNLNKNEVLELAIKILKKNTEFIK